MTENQLYPALAKAQGVMTNPELDGYNPHFKAKFSTLAAVRNAVVPALSANGIAVVQDVMTTPTGISVITKLLHASGQFLSFGPLEIPIAKQDAQGIGSAETYARRYALLAALCIAGEEDDDGAAATVQPISAEQAAEITELLQKSDVDTEGFLKTLCVDSVEKIAAVSYGIAKAALKTRRRVKE